MLDELYLIYDTIYLGKTYFIQNIYYGITEQEMRTWPMQQYLIKIPMREF